MAGPGVFFAISGEQAKALSAAGDDDELLAIVHSIAVAAAEEDLVDTDGTWDAMHRALTDGRLLYGNGDYPLSHCVLGPRQLCRSAGTTASLVQPDEVGDVASALTAVTEEEFRHRYRTIVPRDYAPEYSEDDLDYTWESFEEVRELYARAAADGRAMLFTVDR